MKSSDLTYFPYCSQGSKGTLKVMGYVRGQPLCVNSLVHIPGWGDFQMSRIDVPDDPHPLEKGTKEKKVEVCTGCTDHMMDDNERILEVADPGKQV
jgi:pre-rRNA-processing protein TSR1